MLSIELIQGVWDKRTHPDTAKYIGDQDYLELGIPCKLDELPKNPDFHLFVEGHGHYFGHSYLDGDIISFNWHAGPDFSVCSGREKGHKDHNFCGYAGSTFTYNIDGQEVKVRGMWSSSESNWNNYFEHRVHCVVKEPNQRGGWGGMSVALPKLLELMRGGSHVLIKGLWIPDSLNQYEIVHRDDAEEFVRTGGLLPGMKYNKPNPVRWIGQTPESMAEQIKNAVILDPEEE